MNMEPALKLEYYELDIAAALPSSNYKRKKRVPLPVLICLTAMLVVCAAFYYINQQVVTMQLSVEIGILERQLADLQQEQEYLLLSLKETNRLTTIEAVARQELGMVDPVGTQVLVLNTQQNVNPDAGGWIDVEEEQHNHLFTQIANWLNQLLPVGGVEAGRIGQ